MGRGASPMRTMVRSSPMKPSQENMDSHLVNVGELTPTRKPLSSISESSRNPLVVSDENGGDSMIVKGKIDATTPKLKKRGGQCLVTENADEGNATPEKQGHVKVKKSRARQQSPMKCQSTANVLEAGSVEPGCNIPSSDGDHVLGTGIKGQTDYHGSFKPAAENSNPLTPRSTKSERLYKHVNEHESTSSVRPNSCQNTSSTPSKGVTRVLKYGAAHGPGVPASSTSRALVPISQCGRNSPHEVVEQQFNLEEDPTFWHDHNVQVLIRTRPISSSEVVSQGFSKCLRQDSPHTITWLGPPETRFTFDQVAGEIVTQEKLFSVAGLPMVENCMAGYNSCMFAYGQTGSGKTHTMLGDIENLTDKPSDNRGMTPRVFEYLFSRIKLEEERRKGENLKFLTKCSFLEIYNEQITDLLEPTSTNLQMREDVRKGVYVENLTEVEVNSVQDVIQILSQGSANRKVAATNMNRESSRSHSVFTCIIESRWEQDSMTNIRFGRLNLVDLAGSERQKTSGAEGERLKEAANINKSLSTLGLVIMILVDVANGKQRHVPYRDSKLTFLLQDSLGGNSKTTIIATVSPSSCNSLETLSTLKFAQRAKLIRNTAVINEDASGDVKALRAQIQLMKEELDRLRRQSISRVPLSQDDFNPIRSSVESWGDARKFFGSPQVPSRKFRQMEVVVAGALRREQAVCVNTKRLAAEIEQLNRLIHQREAETQSSKMILRFREDKIRRLETLPKGILSVDSYLADERNMLMEELQILRDKVDRNPELTRLAMENVRLLDQIRSLQDFHAGGEKEVMLEEITNLREQLLEVLDGKIAEEKGLGPLATPQIRVLAPELAATVRENELLRIEADNYRSEVEDLRSNLSAALDSFSQLGSQMDELQETVDSLKVELAAKNKDAGPPIMKVLELENLKHLELIADLKLQLEKSEENSGTQECTLGQLHLQLQASAIETKNLHAELEATKEAFEATRAFAKKLQTHEAVLVSAQYAAAVKQIRLETEEMAVQQSQSLTNIQEMAVLFRMKEIELRGQLEDAQLIIKKLSAKEQENRSSGASAQPNSNSNPNSVRAEDGSLERLQRAQEIEMRHAEDVMQLQLELESLEAVLDEERVQKEFIDAALSEEISNRRKVEDKVDKLIYQLQEAEHTISKLKAAAAVRETTYFDAVSKLQLCSPDLKSPRRSEQLDQDKSLMEALENHHHCHIQEYEALQVDHMKLSEKLERREERENILRENIFRLEHELSKEQEIRDLEREFAELDEGGVTEETERLSLEKKLEHAKQELAILHSENLKLKEDELVKGVTQCLAGSETVTASTFVQSELVDLRAEVEVLSKELAGAREMASELTGQLDSTRMMLTDVKGENLLVVQKFESMLNAKDMEIDRLRKEWQSATVKLIDYLAEGDQALNEASFEMEQIFSDYLPSSARSSRDRIINLQSSVKMKSVELKHQLQHAQDLAKDAEARVVLLNEAAFAMATAQAQDAPRKVHRLSMQAAEALEILYSEADTLKLKLLEFERCALVMSVFIKWLVQSGDAKSKAGSTGRVNSDVSDTPFLQDRNVLETKQFLLRNSVLQMSQATVIQDEHEDVAWEDMVKSESKGEMDQLQFDSESAVLRNAKLVLLVECFQQELSDSSISMDSLKEQLALTLSRLKDAECKAAESTAAHETLAIVKEVWEDEKRGLQSDLSILGSVKHDLEAEIQALKSELAGLHLRLNRFRAQGTEVETPRIAEASAPLKANDEVNALIQKVSEQMSCMSVPKEDEEDAEMRTKLDTSPDFVSRKETALADVEKQLSESGRASTALSKSKDDSSPELFVERNEISASYTGSNAELTRVREELKLLQAEVRAKETPLQDSQIRASQADTAFAKLSMEKEAVQSELEARDVLHGCLDRIAQADAVIEQLVGEKEVLQSQLGSMTLEASMLSSRLCEAEEAQSCLQHKVSIIEDRIAEYESKEQSLILEIEDLYTARSMSDEDVVQLQNEVLGLRRERDSLNLEVSTMDMQSAISDKLQHIQSFCIETDDRITSMQLEMEALTSSGNSLKSEFQAVEAISAQLFLHEAGRGDSLRVSSMDLVSEPTKLVDVAQGSPALSVEAQSSPKEFVAANVNPRAAEENIACKPEVIDRLICSKARKEKDHRLLSIHLEDKEAKLYQVQEKLDELTMLVQEYSTAEECWKSEKKKLLTEVQSLESKLKEKELHYLAVQEERETLDRRVQIPAGAEDAAPATISSLKSRNGVPEALDKNSGKNLSFDADEIELAKARAALAGAEEKVKLLVDANATMTDAWEGERSRLNADKELMQLEISRLENPVMTISGTNSPASQDADNGKDHYINELKQVMKRTSSDCEKLRSKLRERDNTILSVKLQLEEAMVHYKEAEIEMEKTIREKEDAVLRIAELEAEVSNAQDEIMRRRKQVESFERELDNVVVRVTQSEAQRRQERVESESPMDIAVAKTRNVECVDELLYRGEAVRDEDDEYSVLEVKLHKNNSSSEMYACEEVHESMRFCMAAKSAIDLVSEEFELVKIHFEKELELLAVDVKSLSADMFSWFSGRPVVHIQEDLKHIMEVHGIEVCSLTEKIHGLECLLAERKVSVSTLHSTLQNVREVQRKSVAVEEVHESVNNQRAADTASACADLENTRVELEMSEAAVSELLAAVGERDATMSALESALKQSEELSAQLTAEVDANRQEIEAAKLALSNVNQLRALVDTLQKQVVQKEELIKGLEYDINLLEESGTVDAEKAAKTIFQLQRDLDDKYNEVIMLKDHIVTLEAELYSKPNALATLFGKDLIAAHANAAEASVENANFHIKAKVLESELEARDVLVRESECVIQSLKSELENAKSFMAENEAVAIKARQSAEVFKSKSEELIVIEDQLRNKVPALQNKVNKLEKEVEEQIHMRELAEEKLTQVRPQGSTFPILESEDAQVTNLTLERKLNLLEADLLLAQQRRESLQSLCEEKDLQIKALNAHINQLTPIAGKRTSDNEQQVRLEESVQRNLVNPLARTSSIDPSIEFRNVDAAASRRIEKLEALAAERLKEVYALNAKIADLESEMHDVVRELVRTNLDVQNIKLNNPRIKEIVATVRRQSVESQKLDVVADVEVEILRNKLNEFIEERDSWLEEIQRKQAAMISTRVTAEQMLCRADTLTAENENLKTQSSGLLKRIGELEQEVKKLSGQRNLQQRIHHHAKIKDENNSLRLQVADLNTKLRRLEMMFARVKDELERYRLSAGKAPFPNIDEEQRLRSKLQEAEESKIQLAQQFITLCNAIQQASGSSKYVGEVDQSTAIESIRNLESRLRSAEDEVSEFKLKARIAGEKRRLSELRTFQSPMKSIPGAALHQQIRSSATYR